MKLTLPHWAALLLALLLVIVTWVMNAQANGQLVLPAVAVSVLTVFKTVLQLFTEDTPTTAGEKAAALRAMQRGYVQLRLLVALCIAAVLAFACLVACQGCVNGQPPPVVAPTVDLAVCIFDQYTAAPACRPGGNWVLCTATIATSCGADAAAVERVLTAQRKAMIADGFVLPPAADAGK